MSSKFPNVEAPLSWAQWSQKWKPIILNQRGYLGHEWIFAQDVIMEVPGLNPNDVLPQYSFFGNDGKKRHVDYVILIGELKIAIEVEGWDKSNKGHGKTKEEHDEFIRRLQSLEDQFWKVLPVTNAQHHQEPVHYQNQIRRWLIEAAQAQPTTVNSVDFTKPIQISKPSTLRRKLIASILIAAIVTIGAYVFLNPGNSKNCTFGEPWTNWKQANAWFQRYDWIYGDVAKLDDDGDGIPCERLSGAP